MNDIFLQYGALGGITVAALIWIKVLYSNVQKHYEDERERADRLEKQLDELNRIVRDEYLHTISDATRAIADALDAVRRS